MFEQLLNDTGRAQRFAKERNGGCVGNRIHHSKTDEFLERSSVIDLEFQLLITEVEQLLQLQHLEEAKRVDPFLPALLLRSWVYPCCSSDRKLSQGIDSEKVVNPGFLRRRFWILYSSSQNPRWSITGILRLRQS